MKMKGVHIAYLLPDPAALGSNRGSGVFSEKISDVAVLIDGKDRKNTSTAQLIQKTES